MLDYAENGIDFELLIVKVTSEKFKATSPLFPTCRGLGSNREEAITKLCKSISSLIAKKTNLFLSEQLLKDNYSEVITDISKTDQFQHCVFNFNSKDTPIKKVYLKPFNTILGAQGLGKKIIKSTSLYDLKSNQDSSKSDDSILGISVCLN